MTRVVIGLIVLVQYLVAGLMFFAGLREWCVGLVGWQIGVSATNGARITFFTYVVVVAGLGLLAMWGLGRRLAWARRLALTHFALLAPVLAFFPMPEFMGIETLWLPLGATAVSAILLLTPSVRKACAPPTSRTEDHESGALPHHEQGRVP